MGYISQEDYLKLIEGLEDYPNDCDDHPYLSSKSIDKAKPAGSGTLDILFFNKKVSWKALVKLFFIIWQSS